MVDHEISDAKLAEFMEAFKIFDKDGNKELSIKELEEAMNEMGQYPSIHELRLLISEVSANPDHINEEEFIKLMHSRVNEGDTQNELCEAFKLFDHNGTGLIEIDKLKNEMLKYGNIQLGKPEELEILLQEADTDNDGFINYEEFIRIVFNY